MGQQEKLYTTDGMTWKKNRNGFHDTVVVVGLIYLAPPTNQAQINKSTCFFLSLFSSIADLLREQRSQLCLNTFALDTNNWPITQVKVRVDRLFSRIWPGGWKGRK